MENMGSTNSETPTATAKTAVKPYGRVVLTTKNCLLPEEKLSVTPSEVDGLDRETETDLRIYGCELIQTAGILLKLPQVAMATGQVLLQRFYYSKSLVRHPIEHTAMGCVCLASKIEEAPRRVRDIINVFNHIKQVNSKKTIQPIILDQNYIALKTQVIKAERRVLKELGFCVHIKHPHKIIVMYLQVLSYEKNKTLMQIAWNYMNDSLRTDVFLRYQPEVIACACIYLTARKIKLPLPKSPAWYTIFGVAEKDIKDVCLRILRLYNRPKANIEVLEKKVEELCKKYQEAKLKARGVTSDGNAVANCRSPVSPQQEISSGGSHNAWGGFISRSGSHIAPPVITKDKPARSRSRSISPPPVSKHKSKRHNCKSYSRSRSRTPPSKQSRKSTKEKNQHKSVSRSHEERSFTYDKNDKYDKYADRDKYHRHSKDDRYIEYDKKDSYNDKTDKNADKADKYYDKYIKDDKYSKDEKYTKDSRERDTRYKKSKHREDDRERSKDQRR